MLELRSLEPLEMYLQSCLLMTNSLTRDSRTRPNPPNWDTNWEDSPWYVVDLPVHHVMKTHEFVLHHQNLFEGVTGVVTQPVKGKHVSMMIS